MAKTVNEAMTAIADTIRHNALNDDDPIERPLSLDDMPDAISQVRNGGYGKGYQQGYEEGEEFGFSDGWVDNENMVVGELYDPVQKRSDPQLLPSQCTDDADRISGRLCLRRDEEGRLCPDRIGAQ